MPKLTVLIPCKDERQNIAECIASARLVADEVLVADSGSIDGTLDIVRSNRGCRLIEREFIDYANFKNWAIPQAKHDWVLVLDADERVTPELASEIHMLLVLDPSCDAYRLARINLFLGQEIKHCGWNTATLTRLFRKSVCRYRPARVHEDVEVDSGRIGNLRSKLLHYTARDLESFVAKQVRYSHLAAADAFDHGRRPGYASTLLHAPLRFLQLFVLRAGFRDGFAGLVLCLLMAFYAFLKDANLWALAKSRDRSASVGTSAIRRAA